MDDESCGRSTPPIFLTFDTEEPYHTRVAKLTSSYLKTVSVLLKIPQMALSLFFLICLGASGFIFHPSGICFGTIAIVGSSFTSTLLASYLVGMEQKHPNLPWLKTDFIFCSIMTLSNFSAFVSIICLSDTQDSVSIVGVCFSLLAMLVYGVDAWLKYREYRMSKMTRKNISLINVTYNGIIQQRY